MLQTLAKVMTAILRSLFISLVMLLVVISVITGQFPPDFSKLRKTYQNLQEMSQLSQKFAQVSNHSADQADQNNQSGNSDEADIAALEKLNAKRRELGEGMFQAGPATSTTPTTSKSQTEFFPDTRNQRQPAPQDINHRVRELEFQLYRLQQRVNQLEEQAQQKSQHQ